MGRGAGGAGTRRGAVRRGSWSVAADGHGTVVVAVGRKGPGSGVGRRAVCGGCAGTRESWSAAKGGSRSAAGAHGARGLPVGSAHVGHGVARVALASKQRTPAREHHVEGGLAACAMRGERKKDIVLERHTPRIAVWRSLEGLGAKPVVHLMPRLVGHAHATRGVRAADKRACRVRYRGWCEMDGLMK